VKPLLLWKSNKYYIFCVCVHAHVCVCVALVIQHTKHMLRIILSSVAYLAVQHFSILPHKQHNFQKKVIDCKICVLIFYTNFI
jgi:hypothetical protein